MADSAAPADSQVDFEEIDWLVADSAEGDSVELPQDARSHSDSWADMRVDLRAGSPVDFQDGPCLVLGLVLPVSSEAPSARWVALRAV